MESLMRRLSVVGCASLLLVMASLAQAMPATVTITADNSYDLYVNGAFVGAINNGDGRWGWDVPEVWNVTLNPGSNVIAVFAADESPASYSGIGVIAKVEVQGGPVFVTDGTWRVAESGPAGWNTLEFDDSAWSPPLDMGPYNSTPWVIYAPPIDALSSGGARWLWRGTPPYSSGYGYYNPGGYQFCYLRKTILLPGVTGAAKATWGALKARFR